jgi:outer membrane protein
MFNSLIPKMAVWVFMASFSLCFTARAQTTKTTWSLTECIDYALKNNLRVKQVGLDKDLTQVNVKQSRANMLPSANANSQYSYSSGRTINPTENTFINQSIQGSNSSLSGSVPLFNGFQIQNTIQRNRLDNQAAESDVEKAKNDLILDVVTNYLNIIFADALLENARVQLSSSQQQAERTQKLFRAGSIAESSVLEVNSQIATDELAIINAQNQRDLAELSLLQLLDLRNVKDFEVVKPDLKDPDQEVITFDSDQVYEIAQQRMPEIRSADLRVTSALKGIDISRGAYYPRISLGGAVNSYYSSASKQVLPTNTFVPQPLGFSDASGSTPLIVYVPGRTFEDYSFGKQFSNNLGRSLFLNLSIPLINSLQVRNNVARAQLNHRSAVLSTEVVRNQLRTAIQQAYANALAAQKKFSATRRQLETLELTFRNAEIRFNNGLLNPTEFNLARNNMVRAQNDLIQAKFDYTFKLKILDFYQGKPLSF